MRKIGARATSPRMHKAFGLLMLLAVILGACRSEAAPSPTDSLGPLVSPVPQASPAVATTDPAPPGPAFEFLPADPLLVGISSDPERATGARMPVSGGTITAVGADGSAYSLTVPDGALLSPVQITLIPVVAVSNLDLSGGFVAGVELVPGGLQLMQPAILTITPAAPYPLEDELSYAVHGEEQEALLYPLVVSAAEPTFAISHFSSYFLATGSEENLNAQSARSPSRRSDQYTQRTYPLLRKLRQAAVQGVPVDPKVEMEALQGLIDGYYTSVLEPLIAEALVSEDYRFICQVIQLVLGWERSRQMLGIGVEGAEFWEMVAPLTNRYKTLYLKEASLRCESLESISGLRMALSIARMEALTGGYGDPMVDVDEWFEKCGRFELSLRSRFGVEETINGEPNPPYSTTLEVAAVVPLEINLNSGLFEGRAPLEFTAIVAHAQEGVGGDGPNEWCLLNWSPVPSTLEVPWMILDLNRSEGCEDEQPGERPAPPQIRLALIPGKPAENFKHDCSNVPYYSETGAPVREYSYTPWWESFDMHHRTYVDPELTTYGFDGWTFSHDFSSAWIEFEWSETEGMEGLLTETRFEDTRLELRPLKGRH